jgi:uncharacterized protein YegL
MAAIMALTQSVDARILKTKRSTSSTWSPWSAIVIGSGLEFQTDSKESE